MCTAICDSWFERMEQCNVYMILNEALPPRVNEFSVEFAKMTTESIIDSLSG